VALIACRGTLFACGEMDQKQTDEFPIGRAGNAFPGDELDRTCRAYTESHKLRRGNGDLGAGRRHVTTAGAEARNHPVEVPAHRFLAAFQGNTSILRSVEWRDKTGTHGWVRWPLSTPRAAALV